MNLRWKAFEQALGQRVKDHDARRHMRFWQRLEHYLNSATEVQLWWFRCLPTAVLAGTALFNTDSIRSHPGAWMTGIGVWGLLVAMTRAGSIWDLARFDQEYRLVWVLPLSPDCIFHRLRRQVVFSAGFLFLDFFILYGVIAAASDHPLPAWTGAVACAGLQTCFSLALTLLIVASRINPEWTFLAIMQSLNAFALCCLFFKNSVIFISVLRICNPVGWLNTVYLEGWIRGNAGALWALLPVALVVGIVPLSLRAVKRLHHEGAFKEMGKRPTELFLFSHRKPSGPPTELAEQRHQILAGDFDQPLPLERQGFLERFVARFLNLRERNLVEMLLLSARPWTDNFVGFVVFLVLFLAANALVGFETLDGFVEAMFFSNLSRAFLAALLLAGFLLVAMMLAKGLFLFCWPRVWPEWVMGARGRRVSPYRSFQLLPLNYWEVARVIAKTNALLVLLLIPPAVIFSLSPLLLMLQKSKPLTGLFALKGLPIVWGCSLILLSVKLSVTFLSGLKYWRSWLKAILAWTASYCLICGLMISPTLWLDALLGSAFVLTTLLWFLYCGVRYRKGQPI